MPSACCCGGATSSSSILASWPASCHFPRQSSSPASVRPRRRSRTSWTAAIGDQKIAYSPLTAGNHERKLRIYNLIPSSTTTWPVPIGSQRRLRKINLSKPCVSDDVGLFVLGNDHEQNRKAA